jgi:hypothetical protein
MILISQKLLYSNQIIVITAVFMSSLGSISSHGTHACEARARVAHYLCTSPLHGLSAAHAVLKRRAPHTSRRWSRSRSSSEIGYSFGLYMEYVYGICTWGR